jgi:hypothetical protein
LQHVAPSCNTLQRSACAFAFPSFCWCPRLSARVQGNSGYSGHSGHSGYSRSLVPLAVHAIDRIACAATNRIAAVRGGAVATYNGLGACCCNIQWFRWFAAADRAAAWRRLLRPRLDARRRACRRYTSHHLCQASASKCARTTGRPCSGLSRAGGNKQHATSAPRSAAVHWGAPTVPGDIPCRCGIRWDR